jgi:hypothetical protein
VIACFRVIVETPFAISTFYNHGHTVGREFYLFIRVEVGDGLNQTNAAYLEQVIWAFAPFVETLDHAEHQPQITFNQLFPGVFVSGFGKAEKGVHFCMGQGLQARGVYTADLYFSLHGFPPIHGCYHYLHPVGRYTPGVFVAFSQKYIREMGAGRGEKCPEPTAFEQFGAFS